MTPRRRRRALSLEELELWLASDQAPAKDGWNVSAVDGLLAGIVIGPEPVEPEEWTRLIFGARPLGRDSDAALQVVLDLRQPLAALERSLDRLRLELGREPPPGPLLRHATLLG